jgi:hypothetical protein
VVTGRDRGDRRPIVRLLLAAQEPRPSRLIAQQRRKRPSRAAASTAPRLPRLLHRGGDSSDSTWSCYSPARVPDGIRRRCESADAPRCCWSGSVSGVWSEWRDRGPLASDAPGELFEAPQQRKAASGASRFVSRADQGTAVLRHDLPRQRDRSIVSAAARLTGPISDRPGCFARRTGADWNSHLLWL